jgi:hypothetical protein
VAVRFESDTFVPRDGDTFAPRFGETDWENMPIPYSAPKHEIDYDEWLKKGKELSDGHGNIQWALGDWLVDGQCEFDYKDIVGNLGHLALSKVIKDDGSIGYKGPTVPSFWKDAAAETNQEVQQLKDFSRVARRYAPDTRFKELSYSHHRWAEPYERRLEYLAKCLEFTDSERENGLGKRPRSIAWLADYIRKQEGEREVDNACGHYVRVPVSEEMWKKLKQLKLYYRKQMPELLEKPCIPAIEAFLEAEAYKISLKKFNVYEGNWPLGDRAAMPKLTKAGKPFKSKNNPAVRAKLVRASKKRWDRDREPISAYVKRQGNKGKVAA